ncbi:protein translocase subunit SecF [Hoyosella altamirensis]|uniref:Protein-export membrane protein SecF n=1 Tax=Hoyosella altamirensis TaxID=616997 RepID=A0A839RTR9_9ACTN|nr:protein translocase subunit SecF [Hoyosella altamirensis]MBB3039960.1 preprotein translocase subunit SecF [Hoyosella altamirensis]
MTSPDAATSSAPVPPGAPRPDELPRHGFFYGLYTGTGAFNIVGRKNLFFLIAGAIVAISIAGILIRGFTFGIDFAGGTRVDFPAGQVSVQEAEEVFTDTLGISPTTSQVVGTGATASIQIRSEALEEPQIQAVQRALFEAFQPLDETGTPNINAISVAGVSETWGDQVTEQAIIALIVFFVIVCGYIALRFEWYMSLAAMAAVTFDLTVTAGVYAIVGFEVSPATIIGLLTILGYSLYDTVVVFDKVQENTRGVTQTTRRTYAEQANLGVNQTLMRSFNTSLVSVLPIASLMIVAVWMLGVGTLKDLALVQLVGVLVGTYSSIFFATPLLVWMKQRTEEIKEHTSRVMEKRAERTGALAAATVGTGPAVTGNPVPSGASESASGTVSGEEASPPAEGITPGGRRGRAPSPGARPTGKRKR